MTIRRSGKRDGDFFDKKKKKKEDGEVEKSKKSKKRGREDKKNKIKKAELRTRGKKMKERKEDLVSVAYIALALGINISDLTRAKYRVKPKIIAPPIKAKA